MPYILSGHCAALIASSTKNAYISKQTQSMLHLLQLDMSNFRSATRTASCLIKLGRFDEALITLQQFQAALPAGSGPPREWQTKMQELSDAKTLLAEVSFCRLVVPDDISIAGLQDADTVKKVWFTVAQEWLAQAASSHQTSTQHVLPALSDF